MNNYPNFKNYMNSNAIMDNINKMNYMNNLNPSAFSMEQITNKNLYSKTNSGTSNYLDQDSTKLYDPYNGFVRGNMFKNLYDPYKLQEPYEVKPMNEQAELLTYIDTLGFAMIDLNLYLDIFPEDKNMIKLFNQYREEKENLMKEYEMKYGPITLSSNSLNSFPWSWDDMPWPWTN